MCTRLRACKLRIEIILDYLDEEDVLWRTRSAAGARAQLVVPISLRDTIFNDSHHTTYGGHFGTTHTHSKIQLHYFWPGMSDFIRDKITACHAVQITFIFIGQTHLVFGKRVCTCVTKHSNAFRTFLNWLKNSKRVWHEPKLHIMHVPLFANFDL